MDNTYASQFTDEELYADLMKYDKEHQEYFKQIEEELGIKRGLSMNHEQANTFNVNPNYDPILEDKQQYRVNCQTCVPTYMLRRWGFDVEAMKKSDFESTGLDWHARFLKKEGGSVLHSINNFSDKSDAFDFIQKSTKDDGIYEIYVKWKMGGAHVYTYIRNGKEGFAYDPQSGWKRKLSKDLGNAVLNYTSVIKIDESFVNKRMCGAMTKANKKTERI